MSHEPLIVPVWPCQKVSDVEVFMMVPDQLQIRRQQRTAL
jgi:hypothetical protein